jgi:ribose transport system substrate-binding protein
MKTRKALGAVAVGVFALALAACSNAATDTGTGDSTDGASALPASCSDDKPVIGVALPNTINPYYIAMQQGFEDHAEELGYTVDVAIANDSESDQLAQIDAFVQKGVCAIALNAVNSDTGVSSVKAANQAGIPVFSVNVTIDPEGLKNQNATIVQYVGADQKTGGQQLGEQAIADLGTTDPLVVGILGEPSQIPTNQRDEGFTEAIKANPNATVLETLDTNVDPAVSLQVTGELLQGNPNVNVIFGDTGPAVVGALQAIKEAGKQDQIKVYGFCAADTPLEGEYVACAAQEPYEYAKIVLDNVQTYLGGDEVPAEVLQPLKLYTTGETVGEKEFG